MNKTELIAALEMYRNGATRGQEANRVIDDVIALVHKLDEKPGEGLSVWQASRKALLDDFKKETASGIVRATAALHIIKRLEKEAPNADK